MSWSGDRAVTHLGRPSVFQQRRPSVASGVFFFRRWPPAVALRVMLPSPLSAMRGGGSPSPTQSAFPHMPTFSVPPPPRPGPGLAPRQAAHDYVAEDHYKDAEGADAPLQVERRLYRKTAVAFLKRTAEMKPSQMERPVKRQRIKAHSALVRLESALQSHFSFGLVKRRQPGAVEDRVGRPEAWPRLTIGREEGSDMLCACHFLQRVHEGWSRAA